MGFTVDPFRAGNASVPKSVPESDTDNPNTAPLRDTVDSMLGPAIVNLVQYLGGAEALTRLAKTKSSRVAGMEEAQVRAATKEFLFVAAVEKLNDQGLLADIARSADDPDVRCQAVRRLTNQAALADIAKADPEVSVRREAETRLGQLAR